MLKHSFSVIKLSVCHPAFNPTHFNSSKNNHLRKYKMVNKRAKRNNLKRNSKIYQKNI